MTIKQKRLRFYYWLFLEFGKKHSKKIFLSFFISFFIILSIISFSSYLDSIFFAQTRVVGQVGTYSYNTLPQNVLEKISYGLVYVDPKGLVKSAMAQSWETSNNRTVFTFHLKKNLTWDDGKPFNAHDITYTFKDVDTKVTDDYTIVFTLKKPLAIFPTYLTKPVIRYPLHGVVGQYKVDKVHLTQGSIDEMKLLPNSSADIPIIYKFYDNETKLVNAYKTGEVHEMTVNNSSIAQQFTKWKNSQVHKTVDYSVILTVFFNFKNQLLAEKEVRQTLGQAIDRNSFKESGVPAIGPIPQSSWAYNENMKRPIYDPQTATETLKKYITASTSAQLNIVTFYDYLPYANVVQNHLNDIGLKTDVTLVDANNPRNFDLLVSYWQPPGDPDQYFFWHSQQTQSGNLIGYKNVRIDKLLEDGRDVLDLGERKKIYDQFQRLLVDDSPALFLFNPYSYTIVRK